LASAGFLKLVSAMMIFVSAALLTWITVSYALTSSYVLHSAGMIKGLGVGIYSDNGCTRTLTSIDWGMADPGSTKNVTIYVRNEGNTPITLSLSTANWNPSNAANYMPLSWNYNGQTIAVNQVVQITHTLSISSNIQGITAYSFDIVISAAGLED
jgi:hypothetical protein